MAAAFRRRRPRIDTILASEANESGAVALGALMAIHGRHLSLTQLKNDCGISRDGCTPAKLLAAAELHGLLAELRSAESIETLIQLEGEGRLPAIAVGPDNRYSLLLHCEPGSVELFDTARGNQRLAPDNAVIEELLLLQPGPDFQTTARPASIWAILLQLFTPLRGELSLLMLITSASVVPVLMIAGGTSQFIDGFLQQHRLSFGIPIAWLVLIAIVLSLLLTLFRNLLIRRLEYVLTRSLAATLFETTFSTDFSFYQQRRTSEIAGRLNFAMYIPNIVISQFTSACLQLWAGLLVIGFSVLISPILFSLLLTGFLAAAIYNTSVTLGLSTNNDALASEGNQAAARGVQAITNIEAIKSSGLEFTFLRDWQNHYLESIRQRLIIGKLQIRSSLSVNGSIFAITALLLGVGGLLIINGSLSLGSLLAFLFLQSQINNAIVQIPDISSSWQTTQGMLRRIHDIITAPRDPYLRGFNRTSDLPIEAAKLTGSLDLIDVCYAFSPVDPPYIRDLNIHVEPGQQLALVGGSGSGKSTIIRMLAGFTRPCSGEYRLGGRTWLNIPDLTLRSSLAYVPQDVFIFNASFEENIRVWRPGFSHADVVAAAQAAALHEEIMLYAESYDTPLSDNGTNISGGQRQRIEIARALLKQPSILLLDEATSALDNSSEEHVLSTLRAMGITVISVAHRLTAALISDQVVVLEQGRVVEQGHPDELLAREGAFHRLVAAEASLKGNGA